MRIQEIEIDNFKSFARPTKIPFLDGFTAITGPNGSGKSNIIDSVLFGLGLSSTRTMRAEKLTDLIHLGSRKREARVTLRFGDGQGQSLTVARRLRETESGYQSTYYLDGKACTLGELHATLALHNVSPNGYNVVMQGDVTRIVTMTPFERRKIIDEIAGVAEFDTRVAQAQVELSKVDEQEQASALLATEIGDRLKVLAGERDHALKYQALRDERSGLERTLQLTQAWELQEKVRGLEDTISASREREQVLIGRIAEAEAEVGRRKAAYDELQTRIQDLGARELDALGTAIQETRAAIASEQATAGVLETRRQELDRTEAREAEARALEIARGTSIDDRRRTAETDLARHTLEIQEAHAVWQAAHDELAKLYSDHTEVAERATSLRRELNEVKDLYNERVRTRLQLVDENRRAEDRQTQVRQGLETDREARKHLARERDTLDADLASDRETLTLVETERHEIARRFAEATEQLKTLEQDRDRARDRLYRAEATLRSASEGGMGRAVDTILQAQMRGVHGTLAMLGEVEPEYAVALEIAAGGRLRNLVVEDDGVAARGIELLKQSRAGRATFLPLNKLPSPRRLAPTGLPGFIGYAVHLVKHDARFAAAFHHALGDTVIVRDLDHARPYMGQYRMVTLDGELLEKSGAMTGGSDGKGGGVRFLASLQREVDEAREFHDTQVRRHERQKQLVTALEGDAQRAIERQRTTKDGMRERELELADRTRRLGELETRLQQGEALDTQLVAALADLASKQEALREEMFSLEDRQNQLELEISDIDELLENDRVQELASQVDAHDYTVKRLEGLRGQTEHALKGLELEQQAHLEALGRLDASAGERLSEREDLTTRRQALEATLRDLQTTLSRQELEQAALKERLGHFQQEREQLWNAQREAESQVLQLVRERDRLVDGQGTVRQQIDALRLELGKLEEALWADGLELPTEPPSERSLDEVKRHMHRLDQRMREMEPVNMLAIQAHDREAARLSELEQRLGRLTEERLALLQRIEDISQQKKAAFMKVYDQIAGHFSTIFAELAAGTGNLRLENPEDPFSGGLILQAQPKDKPMQRLEAMSGGEKSLTALAFLFSFQRTNPAPFYAFDEVDAALDGANADRLAAMVKKQTTHAQCIVISHRRPMLERSDQTIGISARQDGITRVLGVRWAEQQEAANA
ncbi:MAG: chromosome segregation protein SMC [bacterium]|nr:chromosome segregation protein SMC [bacterium]